MGLDEQMRDRVTRARCLLGLEWFVCLLVVLGPTLARGAEDSPALTAAAQVTAEAVALFNAGQLVEAEPLLKRALALLEQALGTAHPEVATSLHNLAALYYAQGRYADAEPLHRRALAIREQALGPTHPGVATSLNNLATVYAAQGRYAEAEPLYQRALAIYEQTLGPDHPTTVSLLNKLAGLYDSQGLYAQAEPLYQRVLQILEPALGPMHPEVAKSLNTLAELYRAQGRYTEAEPLHQRALRIREHTLGPEHPDVALSLNNLAGIYDTQGRYAEAEPLYQQALRIWEQALGPEDPKVANALNNLATLYAAQGRYAEAEPLHWRALHIRERALGPVHPDVALSLNNLAGLYRAQGRYTEAESLQERVVHMVEQAPGPDHPTMATSLNNLAGLYDLQGRYAEAEPLYQRTLRIRERALGPEHPDVAVSLNNLAGLYRDQGHYAEAEPLYQRAIHIWTQALGPDHPNVARGMSGLAESYRAQGRYAEAEPLHWQALHILEPVLGPEHPDVARSLSHLAMLLEQQRPAQAQSLYERARRIYLSSARVNADLDDAALRGLRRASHEALSAYLAFLAQFAHLPQSEGTAATLAAHAAFVVAEQIRAGAAQAALAQAGARAAATDPATAQLARQVQTLREQRQAVRIRLTAEYGKLAAQRDAERLMHLQQEERDLDHALTAATETLRTAFPRYATLTMPEPLELPALAQLLHPDEGLVSFFTLDDRLLLWLARRDQAPVYREVTSTRTALQTLVQRVRTSLDQTTNPALATGQVLPFDVADAARLYTLLLAPLHEHLGGVTHLFIVPDEVLLPLPFGALITQADGEAYQTLADLYEQQLAPAPSELSAYAQISWLVQAYALTVLPSATALRALRQTERTQGSAVEPFIGFGDPALQGQGTQRGGSMLGVRGTAETGRALARMNRLPATREELLAIATVLGADPDAALYLGPQATETKVRELNTAGRLGQTRVLAFATHGLLAGEATGLTQPALVLTPPAVPSEQDDGLLSLEDILQLKLPHTDWVVLSACNTAAADSSGEGLSGLARAFFFAGARALLVSHWSVDDRATRALMTATFQLHTGTPTQAPAEMLRRGMLALMTQAAGTTTYFAHPYAWAPFFLVGEGGRDAAPTSR